MSKLSHFDSALVYVDQSAHVGDKRACAVAAGHEDTFLCRVFVRLLHRGQKGTLVLINYEAPTMRLRCHVRGTCALKTIRAAFQLPPQMPIEPSARSDAHEVTEAIEILTGLPHSTVGRGEEMDGEPSPPRSATCTHSRSAAKAVCF